MDGGRLGPIFDLLVVKVLLVVPPIWLVFNELNLLLKLLLFVNEPDADNGELVEAVCSILWYPSLCEFVVIVVG